jgi:hypothetical protein
MARCLLIFDFEIVREILRNYPRKYLDLETGDMAPKSRARDHEVGEGRPAVKWARFLRIPSLWEEAFEIASRFPGTQTMPKARERHREPRYFKAAAIVARNWLASLRLPHKILWYEGGKKTLVCNPGSESWSS